MNKDCETTDNKYYHIAMGSPQLWSLPDSNTFPSSGFLGSVAVLSVHIFPLQQGLVVTM